MVDRFHPQAHPDHQAHQACQASPDHQDHQGHHRVASSGRAFPGASHPAWLADPGQSLEVHQVHQPSSRRRACRACLVHRDRPARLERHWAGNRRWQAGRAVPWWRERAFRRSPHRSPGSHWSFPLRPGQRAFRPVRTEPRPERKGSQSGQRWDRRPPRAPSVSDSAEPVPAQGPGPRPGRAQPVPVQGPVRMVQPSRRQRPPGCPRPDPGHRLRRIRIQSPRPRATRGTPTMLATASWSAFLTSGYWIPGEHRARSRP